VTADTTSTDTTTSDSSSLSTGTIAGIAIAGRCLEQLTIGGKQGIGKDMSTSIPALSAICVVGVGLRFYDLRLVPLHSLYLYAEAADAI
jgi:hypothetical protein